MKVFLKKDIEKVGMAGEIIKVWDGYARNYLIPRGFAVEVNARNESVLHTKIQQVQNRKEVIVSKTSMLAERLNAIKIVLKRKLHDDGKLYGAVSQNEVVDLLAEQGITISKGQVMFDKSIKSKGLHKVTIKLTASLKPQVTLQVVPEFTKPESSTKAV